MFLIKACYVIYYGLILTTFRAGERMKEEFHLYLAKTSSSSSAISMK
jgi:hypothetical protein